MRQAVWFWGACCAVWLVTAPGASAQSAAGGAEPNAAIVATFDAYAAAFNARDAAALAGLWTEDAVYVDRESGLRTSGRSAVAEGFDRFFTDQPTARLVVALGVVESIADGVVSVEGDSTIVSAEGEPSSSSFTAICVAADGAWRIRRLEEVATAAPATPREALRELEWLVGRWVDDSDQVAATSTYRWSAGDAFLIRSFQVEDAEGVASQGTQVVAWDPRAGAIRSWSFNSDGSFGEGVWSRSGEAWLIRSTQTLFDGRVAAGAYVLTPIGDDSLTLELVGHTIDGEPQPAREPVRVVRDAAPVE